MKEPSGLHESLLTNLNIVSTGTLLRQIFDIVKEHPVGIFLLLGIFSGHVLALYIINVSILLINVHCYLILVVGLFLSVL